MTKEINNRKKLLNRDFVLLLQGGAVSLIGDLMYSVAIGFWVYQTTGSNGLMGVMTSISLFVTMFLSPFSGSIVDRINRKWVLVLIDLFQGVIMLAVGILAYAEMLSVPIVLAAAFLAALCGVFYSPAMNTIMLDIIPHDDMVRGQSLVSGGSSMINLVGNSLSGVMVTFLGVPLIVIINGFSNLYSAFSEMLIRVPKTVYQGTKITVKGTIRDMKAAVVRIFSDSCLKIFVPSALVLNLLAAGPFTLMLPFCMEKSFTVDMYGYLMSIQMAGSLISVLLLGTIKFKPKARYLIMAIGFIFSEVMLVGAYLSNNFILTCVMAFLASFLNTAGNTVFNASLMLALPEENRSGILGFIQSASVGGSALSAVIYGLLGEIFPLYIIFSVGAVICLAPMIWMCLHKRVKEFVLSN